MATKGAPLSAIIFFAYANALFRRVRQRTTCIADKMGRLLVHFATKHGSEKKHARDLAAH